MAAKARILAAAERLFAEFGIESVSLRQIAVAAGQRNTSAVAYHYGSKEALVEEIYVWRMTTVNAQRLRRLRELGDAGVSELVRALVEPLAATLHDPERAGEPSWYLRFIAETLWRPQFDPVLNTMRRPEAESVRLVVAGLRRELEGLAPEIFDERMRLVAMLVVTALADRERRLQEPDPPGHLTDLGLEVLVDAATSMLAAPWPPENASHPTKQGSR
ncbi:TetR/AcrR family transcriptional regulator; helix-turn-helix transcriptional regulator [Nocardia yamanashiensis]|uniref:TetR/AcrR family transcriptional regulator n=1 Tax=Nocardia yamanashiensis TaxID=209247 RepID=UPI001E3A8038|nr:TetR/AcrR family transcriptional regulator [Nocardia yamanashiensis]UGT45513.1 TetR/AcrR family transcriptional regulator; helix-turn-helix transcriptional regulator [Nocardia yamanashiensis]